MMSGPSHGISHYWNESTNSKVTLSGGTGAAHRVAPWHIPDGKAVGLYELLNLDGNASKLSANEWIQCDWDYTTTGGRDTDSMSWLYALNMTDGTVIWRRVGHMGCQGIIVDDEHQRIYDTTPGGYVKAYDLITGEKIWWWHNPYALNDTSNSFRTLANWGAFDGDDIYVSAWNGHMYKINGETGETIWDTFTEGFGGCGAYPLYSEESDMVYMSQMSSRGWRTTTTDPGQIVALDATTGEIVWKHAPIWVSSQDHIVSDGRLYVTDYVNKDIICFGAGPTETSVAMSSEQLKAGDTVLISGQLLDKSPPSSGNYDAPCADCSVTLMYCPLGGTDVCTITTVTTGYAGDYYYEWTVPANMTGKYSVVASYAGDNPSYLESSGQVNFRVGEAGLSEAEMEQVGAAVPDYSMMFYAVIAVVIITLALVVFMFFKKK
jgi:outer membrane protein assembly factor BamB